MGARWYVGSMDEGILRVEGSRAAAVEWGKGLHGPRVIERHCYGPGSYDYVLGYDREDHGGGLGIVREDALVAAGFDPEQPALYPNADDPYERVDREEVPA